MVSATVIPTVTPELFAKFQISFYQIPENAVFKALGNRVSDWLSLGVRSRNA